ncbi:MAG: DMT family transporter [Burkholderiaceae bacterium]|nr:DMT family transporter [Burkholderiaceae bacterium]
MSGVANAPGAGRKSIGYLLLAAGMALVGTYVALSRPLTAVIPVFLLAWLRFAIAAIAMLPWLRATPADARLDRRLLGTLFTQSLFGNFLFSICMLIGVSMTSATAAGVILASLPAVVALLSWLLLREPIGRRTLVAVMLAGAGIAALSLARTGASGGEPSVLGNLLVFGSACCEAVYVVLGKPLTRHLSPKRISAIINLFGLALMTPLGLWQALEFDFAAIGADTWALLVFYALAASMFATWLWLTGLKSVPAAGSGVFTIAMPLAASGIGVALLGERPGLAHGFALACAILAIWLAAAPDAAARRRMSPPARRI